MNATSLDTPYSCPRWVPLALETMGTLYVAVAVLFLVNPEGIILWTNTLFSSYGWPMVFFPTERFWYALACSVPGTRAFLAFAAARRPSGARLLIWALQVSLCIAAIMFAFQFLFHQHAPLYALACLVELAQIFFYFFLKGRLS